MQETGVFKLLDLAELAQVKHTQEKGGVLGMMHVDGILGSKFGPNKTHVGVRCIG